MIDLATISAPNRCSNYLLLVRLDNARAIEAVYGKAVFDAAMQHLRQGIAAILDPAQILEVDGDEIVATAHAAMLEPDFVCARVEGLCTKLCMAPMPHEVGRILLSVSVGHSDPQPGVPEWQAARTAARARLASLGVPAAFADPATDHARTRYRDDMARSVQLLDRVENGETFFAWRPVFDPRDPGVVLQHEASLRYAGEQGEQVECTAGYAALERLGFAHFFDRRMVMRVLDELEADPRARLSVAISPQSLSFDLGGHDSAWTDVLARLERSGGLAGRLVLEFHESAACRFRHDTLTFLNTLRELGVHLAVSGFGSGHAAVRQLAVLRPDVVKLDSAFLRTAFLSDRNRARIGQLIGQARSLCGTVILNGDETPAQLRLAVEEGVDWVAAARFGRARTRRIWSAPVRESFSASLPEALPEHLPLPPAAHARRWQSPVF